MSVPAVDQTIKNAKDIEKLKKIDFKMVSFTLAGKDYGIDILKVKEIRKAGNFTHVPNTPVFVRGVDNLRGDIIPIIDLRVMFNLPAERKDDGALENIIILRMEDLIIGVIVDTIEKVVGINSETIQPPHPIFGDINVKYISGVVENDSRLYIILDVERIFGQKEEEPAPQPLTAPAPLAASEPEEAVAEPAPVAAGPTSQENLDLTFISETLGTFAQFWVTPLNREWVAARTAEWKKERSASGQDFQIVNKADAEEFLKPFYSPFNGRLWDAEVLRTLAGQMTLEGGQITVWNPGCGKGYETYSLAAMLQLTGGDKPFKIWANDSDLLSISMAPSLILNEAELSDEYKALTVQAKNGLQFNSELKSRILFEFHDINHINPFTDVHLIVARDVLSFLKPVDQEKVLEDFNEKLRTGGYLILGRNETVLRPADWKALDAGDWVIYQKI